MHYISFLAHLSQRLHCLHCCCCCHKLFMFSSSSLEPLEQFQPNLAPNIHRWRRFKYEQMKSPRPFPKGDNYEIAKIHPRNLKRIHGWRGLEFVQMKNHSILKKEIMDFPLSNSTIWYKHRFAQMFRLIWTGFSGERCGPWASSYGYLMSLLCIMCIITLFLGMESSLYKE